MRTWRQIGGHTAGGPDGGLVEPRRGCGCTGLWPGPPGAAVYGRDVDRLGGVGPLTFEVGVRVLPGARTHADVGELLRTIGFAAVPGLLLAFGALPGLAVPIFAMASLWMLAAMIVAVRQALDYTSTARAIAVSVFGWGWPWRLCSALASSPHASRIAGKKNFFFFFF